MEQFFVKNVLDGEIPVTHFLHWLSGSEDEDEKLGELSNFATRKDFTTYILNVIHEQHACKCQRVEEVETPREKREIPKINASPSHKSPSTLCLGDFLSPNSRNNTTSSRKRTIRPQRIVLKQCPELVERTKNNSFNFEQKVEEIHPDSCKVSNVEQLNKLVGIYEFLMKNGLVLSVLNEVYYLISLLFLKCSCESPPKTGGLFAKSIHNVLYFACNSLWNIREILASFDKPTLKYLLENERIKMFQPRLHIHINKLLANKQDRVQNTYENPIEKSTVLFISDTDNRSNFSTNAQFQCFKKQRDVFYEILKIWEDNRGTPCWNFEAVLARKIRTLLGNFKGDPVNFMRFSKLYTQQLLNTHEKNVGKLELPNQFLNMDMSKFDRLNSRITGSSNNNATSDFTGYQEFFKEFIVAASNTAFVRHLCDVFIAEIATKTRNPECISTKEHFVSNLKQLQVLAKFLAYIETAPYKTETEGFTYDYLEAQVQSKNNVRPQLNCSELFDECSKNGMLPLMVPWTCVYLAMLDPATLRTRAYRNLIEKLIQLYRNSNSGPDDNANFIKFNLGWLFQHENFPHGVFFTTKTNNSVTFDLGAPGLIDANIMYIFVPYLDEIKKLLSTKIRVNVKHITPKSTEKMDGVSWNNRRVEKQLEEAFFNAHPVSLRKTVDFIAERTASICVKHLCYNVIPDFRKRFKGTARQTEDTDERFEQLQRICNEEIERILTNNMETSVRSLLPLDCLEQARAICVKNCRRTSAEKIAEWTSVHLVKTLLTKEMRSCNANELGVEEICNWKPSFALPPGGSTSNHDFSTKSGAHVLDMLRDFCVVLLSSTEEPTEAYIETVLETTWRTLTSRNDINETLHFTITSQTLDLFLLLCTYHPELLENLKGVFVKVWKIRGEHCAELFANVLCPRNLMLCSQSSKIETWKRLGWFCAVLLDERLLVAEQFETQCTALFRTNFDGIMLKNLIELLKCFSEIYKERTPFLVEFFSNFCSDLC